MISRTLSEMSCLGSLPGGLQACSREKITWTLLPSLSVSKRGPPRRKVLSNNWLLARRRRRRWRPSGPEVQKDATCAKGSELANFFQHLEVDTFRPGNQ